MRNLTIRFQVAVRLFSNRSQRTSKCGHGNLESIFLYNKELKYTEKSFNEDVIYTSLPKYIISENQSECVHN